MTRLRRRGVALWLALALCGAERSVAQPGDSASEADVPRGTAVLTGEIVHPMAEPGTSPGAGIEVLLYALPGDAPPGLRHARSDAEGRFRFDGISNAPDTVYLVGARYQGVPFPGARVQFKPGEDETHIKIRIGELSEDASGLRVRELEVELEWRGDDVQVTEVVRVDNERADVAHLAEARRAEGASLFAMQLPEGAENVESPFGIPLEGVARDGRRLRFFGPIYPSAWGGPFSRRQEIAFRYTLPAEGDTFALERPLQLEGEGGQVERVVVVGGAGFDSLQVVGAEQRREDGETRWVIEGEGLGKKLSLAARLPEARSDLAAFSRRQSRVFLELDGAALTVREEHFFHIDGDAPLMAADDTPLLEIAVPRGATDLRFSPEASGWGLRNESATLQFRGPLPVGDSKFELAYQLPRRGNGVVYEYESSPATPLLNVFVADTGLLIETERLHRRRPVNAGTRVYAQQEGFQIDAGEAVQVALQPLRSRGAPPRSTVSVAGALLAGLAAAFLLAPLGGERALGATADVDVGRAERNAIYVALRDLDHDYETGKVSDEDYAALRDELRARAAALFEREDAGMTPDSVTLPNLRSCPTCDEMARVGDRFCAQCGSALEPSS